MTLDNRVREHASAIDDLVGEDAVAVTFVFKSDGQSAVISVVPWYQALQLVSLWVTRRYEEITQQVSKYTA